jgi:antitoxin MazE6
MVIQMNDQTLAQLQAFLEGTTAVNFVPRWFIPLEARYNRGYTEFMKTAISIPDSLFEEADRLAKTRGWSRSELYANAVTAYVNSERFAGVREKLDSVYGHHEEDSAIDPLLADAQAQSLPKEKW